MTPSTSIEQIKAIATTLAEADKLRVQNALTLAIEAHEGQIRKSGDPYLIHPLAVALRLWERFHDIDLLIAGMLHDVVEDCEGIEVVDIYERFGPHVGFLVDSVTKERTGFHQFDQEFEDKIERLLWAGLKDVRVLLLKLTDREHNIETLHHLKQRKQVRMAFETQAIFEPLKRVLHYDDDNITVKQIAKNMTHCLHQKGITTPEEMKRCLYGMSFKNLNNQMFDLVYENSDKVVWELEDAAYFQTLTRSPFFEGGATIQSLWTDGEHFKAVFTFNKGLVLDGSSGLKIATYQAGN